MLNIFLRFLIKFSCFVYPSRVDTVQNRCYFKAMRIIDKSTNPTHRGLCYAEVLSYTYFFKIY